MSREKRQRLSWGISIAFHAVLLLVAAASGLLSLVYADKGTEPAFYEVTLEDSGSPAGEGGGTDAASASTAAFSAPDIVLPSTQQEWIAKELPPQETPAKENQAENKIQESAAGNSSTAGSSQGNDGTGHGDGNGSGNGSGTDSGSGIGTGNGSDESGIRETQRRQPKAPPVLLSAKSPRYPNSLRNAGVEGKVRVRLLVGDGGQVENVEVIESSGYPAMDSAAVEAAYGYRFRPAKNAWEEPVRAYITRRIAFTLQ